MRKMILLASALALGTAAYAQDTTPPSTMPDAGATAPATPDAGMPDASAPPTTPDASAPPMSTPDSATPDSSVPNSSGMSGSPSSTPSGSAMGPSGPVSMTPTQGPTDLPMCSKTVTDNCKQSGSGGGHKPMRHKRHK